MNLGDLKQKVAEETGLSQVESDQAVKAIMEAVTESLQAGETVGLTGFGSFTVSERAARKGRNPRTGETIKITASKVVRFRTGNTLKTAVNTKAKKKAKGKKKK